ncbi:MAG: PepSY-associated TM helix domain-containing protein [Acidobacteriota bacterium]|nr:PepSY-associated TM helix domain-containing protein [Acidobacteriota bacterium]
MPLPSDAGRSPVVGAANTQARRRGWGATLETWNEKMHYYSGLYLLLFIWLFSFTGLVLNHQWEIHNFWAKRHESTFTQKVQPPVDSSAKARAEDLMRQLHLRGEMTLPDSPAQPGRFDFRVYKPALLTDVRVDLQKDEATVHQIRTNAWGLLEMLHTFDVEKRGNSQAPRNWLLSKIWCFTMDAVAVGLILMVLGSYYMWFRLKKIHVLGWISLALGFVICGFFVAGLNWLYRMR